MTASTVFNPPIPNLANWQPNPGSFRDVFDTALGQNIVALMIERDSLVRLQTGGFYGCVAVEALSRKLLDEFGEDVRPDRVKRFIGFIGRKIMQQMGFRIDSLNIKIRDRCLFVSRGASYVYVGEAPSDDQDTDEVTEE